VEANAKILGEARRLRTAAIEAGALTVWCEPRPPAFNGTVPVAQRIPTILFYRGRHVVIDEYGGVVAPPGWSPMPRPEDATGHVYHAACFRAEEVLALYPIPTPAQMTVAAMRRLAAFFTELARANPHVRYTKPMLEEAAKANGFSFGPEAFEEARSIAIRDAEAWHWTNRGRPKKERENAGRK
jgi:hypothetical protein